MFIDIHTHLPQYDDVELDEIVNRWRLNDVQYVSTGTTIDDSERSIFCQKDIMMFLLELAFTLLT